jgi:flagellar hook-associated protein 2
MSNSGTLAVGGLASGIDTNSMMDSLVSIEQQKVTNIQKKQESAKTTLSAFGQLKSQLSTLKDKAATLATMDGFSLYKSTSSDDSVANIIGTGNGVQGSFSVGVNQLASGLKISSKDFEDSVTSLGNSGTLRFATTAEYQKSNPDQAFVDVMIRPEDAISDIAAHINSSSGINVSASILKLAEGDTRLVLTGLETGSDGFKVTDPNATTTIDPVTLKPTINDLSNALGFTSASLPDTSTSAFSLRQTGGGAATEDTLLTDLFVGIGLKVAAGDFIDTGSATPLAVTAETTVQDLLNQTETQLGAAAGSMALDNSGRIVVNSGDVDVSKLTYKMDLAADKDNYVTLSGFKQQRAFANVIQEGQDAFYTLNGLSLQSSKNEDTSTVQGATIQLFQTSGADNPIQVTVTRDDDAIQKSVQDFLDAYNGIQKFIKDSSAITIKETKDAQGKTVNTPLSGPLTGEFSASSIKSQLQSILTSAIPQLAAKTQYTSLASIGITTTAKTGELTMDVAKFKKSINNDFDGVRRLFASSGWTNNPAVTVGHWSKDTKAGTYAFDTESNRYATVLPDGTVDSTTLATAKRNGNLMIMNSGGASGMFLDGAPDAGTGSAHFVRGVADQIAQLYSKLTSYNDGSLNAATKSVQQRSADISKQVAQQQGRVDSYKDRLSKQFAAMEQAMQKIKSQNSSFSSQLGRS